MRARKRCLLGCLLLSGCLLLVTGGASVSAQATKESPPPGAKKPAAVASIADLAWLAGCWARVDGESGSGEQWTSPAGGTMLGVSRTIQNGKTVDFEFMQIREDTPGTVVYVARPSGQKEATFRLVACEGKKAVFENPGHDFPQRVIYELTTEGVLAARIEGKVEGKDRVVEFPMSGKNCP